MKKIFCKNQQNSEGGYSLIELLVVVAIISVLTAVVVANFPKVKLQLALSRTAYKFEQDLRKAQGLALSTSDYKDSGGVTHPVDGFGAFINLLSNKQYIIYADNATANQVYDAGVDYIVDTVNLETGIVIKEVDCASGNNVSINFKRPNPTTTIAPLLSSPNQAFVVFAMASDLSTVKIVSINTAGLVEILSGSQVYGSVPCP